MIVNDNSLNIIIVSNRQFECFLRAKNVSRIDLKTDFTCSRYNFLKKTTRTDGKNLIKISENEFTSMSKNNLQL